MQVTPPQISSLATGHKIRGETGSIPLLEDQEIVFYLGARKAETAHTIGLTSNDCVFNKLQKETYWY